MDKRNNILPPLFGEEDFNRNMNTVVAEFLEKSVCDGSFPGYDGKPIHYYAAVNPKERGTIVISHGFCEFFGKYHEMAYYFYEAGYSVFFLEHRGHGHSWREVPDLEKVYIRDYDQYVEDLKCFLDEIVVRKSRSKRWILYAHSMGGAIGALFLEKHPEYFEKAILSTPLMEMNFQGIPWILVQLLLVWSRIVDLDKEYAPNQHGFDYSYRFESSCTMSEPRYAYGFHLREQVPEYRNHGGCYGWTRASIKATRKLRNDSGRVKIPVLLFQAGKDTMVKPKGQEVFQRKSKCTRIVRYPEAKHELFNGTPEIRQRYYQEIFQFLEQ